MEKAQARTWACLYQFCETDNELYVTGDRGALFRSKNGGGSWDPITIPKCGDVLTMTATPNGNMWAGTRNGELAISSDRGASWTVNKVAERGLCRVAVGPRVVIVGDDGVVLQSESLESLTLQRIDVGCAGDFAHAIFSESRGFVAIESAGTVITSVDGSSWTVHKDALGRGMWGVVEDDAGELVAVGNSGTVTRSEFDPN